MKFNRKLITGSVIGKVLLIALISATLITTYGLVTQNINVDSPIQVDSSTDDIDITGGINQLIEGEPITITNNADFDVEVQIVNDAEEGINVSYIGSLTMVEKDTSTWEIVDEGNSETITYTIVGDEFVINDIPEGYTLIYYPNTEGNDFANNIAEVEVLSEGVNNIGNLPFEIDVGDDYCNVLNSEENIANPNANQCSGAKFWLILGSESEALAKLSSWNTEGFLFETDLIQYNAEGNLIMSGNSEMVITPVYNIASNYVGNSIITTSINPVA